MVAVGHPVLESMSSHSNESAPSNDSLQTSLEESPASPNSPHSADQPSPRLNSPAPLPNPPFVFPARLSPSSAHTPASQATIRRPLSASELGGRLAERMGALPPNLPSFSFNPSAGSDTYNSGIASPPKSPQSPNRAFPTRTAGHKRGTSEFNGTGLVSTSPTKSAPSFGPSSAGRGHAHRRSAAISSHDLTMILKPNNSNIMPRGGSAPVTPSDYEHKRSSFAGLDSTIPMPDLDTVSSPGSSPPVKALNRNRVGFSDTLEFIPRPLSLVSSDTSSTVKGHSLSGSLSSIVSAGASSPPTKEQRGLPSPSPSLQSADTRPRTAGSILDGGIDTLRTPESRPSPRRRSSNPLLSELAAGNPTSPTTPRFTPKKWGFFGHDLVSGESSPVRSRPASAASLEKGSQSAPDPLSAEQESSDTTLASIEPPNSSRRSSVSRKPSKKQKKVKSWAGSILTRKSRPRSQKQKGLSRRSPTPPLRSYALTRETEPTFDLQHAGVPNSIAEPIPRTRPELQTDFASWKPRHIPPPDDESMSPIIDLDAALGPFNTPSGYDAAWDASQRGPGPTKRRMHSAAGMGGFVGPGMHYHRRTESAPEMVAFEHPRFGLHRLGSSSTMADVFEEDEEDAEWEDAKSPSEKGTNCKGDDDEEVGSGIDIKVVDAENMEADKTMDWTVDEAGSLQRGVKRKGSGLSDGDRRHVGSSMKSEHSSTSLKDEPILEESQGLVEILDDSIPPRPDSGAQSSDSTTPPFRGRPAKDLAPVDIQPISPIPPFLTPTSPNSTFQSSFPSPRSPYSYDAQRISTAPSSVTEEHSFESLLLGQPGPELRVSVDDVPSLTSSNSTMTRESAFNLPANIPQFRDGQRSASLSSITVTRKRSSMASLSRLISSSHGEKSKLSIESRPSSTIEIDRKDKGSRGKRISRMMQFWKAKDSN